MNRLTPWLVAVLALAGCAKNTSKPTAKMQGPTGVALFRGYDADLPGSLRHLVAVSNTRGDDLRIIDAVTDKVLLGPTLVAALTIPTESRPTLIAAGRLEDLDASGAAVGAHPDLLVVAPRGLVARPTQVGQFAAAIQQVVTWEPAMRVHRTFDLGDLAPDAIVSALAVVPVRRPDGAGGWIGSARVAIGLSDGGLITMEASRTAGSEAIELAAPVRQELGFTALDFASTADGSHLYAATLDPIPGPGGLLGVADLDMTGAPGAFPVRAIPARAGTTRLGFQEVAPFVDSDPNASIPDFDQFGPVVPRVFAAIDQSACGRDRSVPCGVAVIDPVAGTLAADPAGEMAFQMPFQMGGEVVDLAAIGPPLHSDNPGYLTLAPGSGKRWTQSMGAVSSSAGPVYLADLSHFALANDVSSLVGSARARVVSSLSWVPTLTSNTIGLWQLLVPLNPNDPKSKMKSYIDAFAVAGVGVTPGYTPTDNWFVTYQGVLPGLGNRLGVAQVPSAGQPPAQVALQEDVAQAGAATPSWRSVVRVYDPRLAIQPHDIVEVGGFATGVCPRGAFEMEVTGILPPTADAPGGSLAIVPAPVQPTHAGQSLPADPACLPAGTSKVAITIRTWGYALVGNSTGYAGRPQEVLDPMDETVPYFQLKYEDEDLLSCPIMPDAPEAWPPPPADVAACEADAAACRATCERLLLARKARRIFYVTNRCADKHEQTCYNTWVQLADTLTTGETQLWKWPKPLTFPLPKGPAVYFKLSVQRDEGGDAPPERGAYLGFSTGSGYSPAIRVPYSGSGITGAVLPGRVLLHDRTEATGVSTDGIHGFAAFIDNLVLEFAAGSAGQNATVIR